MAEPEQQGDVPVSTESVTTQVHVTDQDLPQSDVTAESLGVDQASFDKYHKDGDFDWASYGKEQAFKAQQATKSAPATETDHDAPAGAEQAVENAGLDWDDLGAQIAESGDISQADYEALQAIGIPEPVVKDYIQSVQGNAQAIIDNVIDGMGGQEVFDQVYSALYSNTTLEQRNKIDDMLRDPDTRDAGIHQAFRLAGMQPPAAGQAPAAPAAQPAASRGNPAPVAPATQAFASFEEQMAAQRDPRYNRDGAYTQEVINRIAVSTYDMNPRSHSGGM